MESNDFGDLLLMLLDDDLFWVGEDKCGSISTRTPLPQEKKIAQSER